MARALEADVPRIYFNGFASGLSTGDVVTVVEQNGRPVAVLNMSYTVAKSYSQGLATVIAKLEEESGRQIMTTKKIETFIAKPTGTDSGT